MKKSLLLLSACALSLHLSAEELETEGSGFLTSMLNEAIENSMEADPQHHEGHGPHHPEKGAPAKMIFGRKVTEFASAPKFGGYYIGKYSYTDQDGKHGGDGLTQRLVRLYVDGTIFKDFKYRIQIQANNSTAYMKDVYLEWARYKEFSIKVGQYKRAFGFENPMNPWDISTGDYALITKKLTGHGDYLGEASASGGRDQGIQVQGDLFPMKDGHRLIHYQLGLWNGQGINTADKDGKKDLIGTFQVQPIKNLYLGFFGWAGNWVDANGVSYDRNRYAFGVKYEDNGWTARAEYMHGESDLGKVNADGWYVIGGMPITDWCKLSAQYQCYREGKEWGNSQNVFSLIPSFQLHKNLMFQVQYNYNDNRGAADKHYNELWGEIYFRF